jgi:hypothetical protein
MPVKESASDMRRSVSPGEIEALQYIESFSIRPLGERFPSRKKALTSGVSKKLISTNDLKLLSANSRTDEVLPTCLAPRNSKTRLS